MSSPVLTFPLSYPASSSLEGSARESCTRTVTSACLVLCRAAGLHAWGSLG